MATVIGWQRLKSCTVTCGNEYCLEPARLENEIDSLLCCAIMSEWRAKSTVIIQTVRMLSEQCQTSAMSKSERTLIEVLKRMLVSYD